MQNQIKKVAVLHGGGYVGWWVIELLLKHPYIQLTTVTSRSGAGQPLHTVHPNLFGKSALTFTDPKDFDPNEVEAVFITAEHKQAVYVVMDLMEQNYQGLIIDLSADFRFEDAALYPQWFGYEHPAPELLHQFVYGLAEVKTAEIQASRWIANPGCFATAINMAMYPISKHLDHTNIAITAMTGASGSGNKPSSTTHFPARSGNMRTYKTFAHQHQPELDLINGTHLSYQFVPVSAPWTYGIWATLQFQADLDQATLDRWYQEAYADFRCVRLWDRLPELLPVVGTPFSDLGWYVQEGKVVIVTAIDNLWKGAASQALQNMNLAFGWEDHKGLV